MDPSVATQTAMSIAVGALVMGIVQALKPYTPEGSAPLAVLGVTLIVGLLYVFSQPELPGRTDTFGVATVLVQVYISAIGLYGLAVGGQKTAVAVRAKRAVHGAQTRHEAVRAARSHTSAPDSYVSARGRNVHVKPPVTPPVYPPGSGGS